ncbi:hypothetical protein A2803_03850 [Candidatus Woesebacteria bacterium RIFCSPHIGHO2_01_FULL_44_21]|uniref:Membrane protein 6-pyruvoyl-tetrahydropterin synthase-related domain-containing protein n=1 Tax=Candidatus Woesebacteria bacterium RIFCSPHIGHO2_01_FULL_44_21 TaxID=1802503 RepID=A0A1F7YWK2_9BACT|nr:MAG: hypothetical protein A2803_03850 [Candidatus Woesebacteria bacterium RIFCSPHIGHO2_01_FULL_44_21]
MIPLVANDFPIVSGEFLRLAFSLPQIWSFRGTGFGMNVVSTLWSWPLDFIYGLGAVFGLNFELLERILGILPIFVVGIWAMSKLLAYYKIGSPGKWVGTLFFLLNTYLLLLVDGGQLSIGLAYAFLPVVFLSVILAVNSGYRKKILSGLAASILAVFDIRFLVILAILVILHSLFSRPKLLRLLQTGIVIGLVFLGLNAYWIFPVIFAQGPTLPINYTRVSQATFLGFAELKHAILLLQPHWPKNVFGEIPPVNKEFILIPVLSLLAILFHRKKYTYFWAAVAVISIFLVKGGNPPVDSLYKWLYANIPGFYIFRDSTKFFVLVAISYSVLISLTVNFFAKKFPKFKVFVVIGVVSSFVFLVRPVVFGQMTGIFAPPVYQEEYASLENKLKADTEFGRIVWLPKRPPLGYASDLHAQIDGLSLLELRPFAVGTVGGYETLNFLRESSFVDELLDISGVKYISYPYPDTRREDLDQEDIAYYHAFSDQISNLPWIESKISDFPVNTFTTRKNQDSFFLTRNSYCIIGSDKIYQEFSSNPEFELAKNVTIFLEESPGMASTLSEDACKYVLYESGVIDLAASFIHSNKFISVASLLDFSPNSTGWWKREATDLIWWRVFLQQKYALDNLDFDYEQGWGVAEGDLDLQLSNSNFKKDNVLLARVMVSARGGELIFSQGEEEVGRINTLSDLPKKVTQRLSGYGDIPDKVFEYTGADFSWYEVGSLLTEEPITITTSGDINVINALVSLSKEEWSRAKDISRKLEVLNWDRLDEEERIKIFVSENTVAKVKHERLSPTKYKVTVSGLNSPATLVFSETYNPLWTMSGENGFKVYSMFNGFLVETNGEYEVVFEAQKYVESGLLISMATALLLGYNLLSGKIKRGHKNKNA